MADASCNTLDALKEKLARIQDLENAARLLEWDQETFMPPGGARARAHQIATLRTLAHELFTAEEIGALLEDTDAQTDGGDGFAENLVRVTRRDYERACRVPPRLVGALATAASEGQHAWQKARANDDFAGFAPHLERLVGLNVQKAEALGYNATPYDALLDEYEPGVTSAEVARVFDALRTGLVPLVEAIAESEAPDDACLRGPFDVGEQKTFGEEVIRAFGYDFTRGRQDTSAHPFTTSFSTGDVRLTTRFDPAFFNPAFFATLHEAGHGLYEQGFAEELARTPLSDAASLGMHESQSRLWENLVGRSRPFWQHYYPLLQKRFPERLAEVGLDTFYRAVNRVAPSPVRVEADEVTYNLHVMLRFEIERALIEGRLPVEDLPGAWNAKMQDYLGLTPATDAEGVLQDVHWAMGAFGYFPTYALGNLMSVQLFRQAKTDLPNLDAQLANGAFRPLLDWLRANIHRHGRTAEAGDLLERATGARLKAGPWLAYVRRKFGALYGVAGG